MICFYISYVIYGLLPSVRCVRTFCLFYFCSSCDSKTSKWTSHSGIERVNELVIVGKSLVVPHTENGQAEKLNLVQNESGQGSQLDIQAGESIL